MQDLTLIGVHEDGVHLLLADADGARYVVPLDEGLRSAVRSERPRLGDPAGGTADGLRPAAVQAMIRSGLSAEEAAHRAGWTVEKVHRYEGPILAEREHVASLARQVRLRSRGASHGPASTLDTRVGERLRSREIDAAAVSWDSRRADKGDWVVSLAFAAGGRRREATWAFDPLARTVAPLDDESRWLSEDDDAPAPGPLPAPHLSTSAGPSRVYDVEAEGGVGASSVRGRPARSTRPPRTPVDTPAATNRSRGIDSAAVVNSQGGQDGPDGPGAGSDGPSGDESGTPLDLVAAMRQRNSQRGRRRRPRGADVPGLENAPEDALPLEELAMDPRDHELPPAQHPRDEDEQPPSAPERDPDPTLLDLDEKLEDDREDDVSAEAPDAPAPAQAQTVEAHESEEPDQAHDHGEDDVTGESLDQNAVDPAAAAAPEPETEPEPPPKTEPAPQEDDGDGELIVEQVETSEPPPSPAPSPALSPGPSRPPARKGGRPSVPSWDDIMFGRKGD